MKKNSWFLVCFWLITCSAIAQTNNNDVKMEFINQGNFNKGGTSLKKAVDKLKEESKPAIKKHFVVSVLLPFNTWSTSSRIDAFLSSKEIGTKAPLITEEARASLEFYDGVLLAAGEEQDSLLELELHFFDTRNNDSITKELLKEKTVQYSNIIIGPLVHSGAKIVADFCKQRKIVNIQPFSPSKSITSDNPYHIKLAPTMDAHIDNMIHSLSDSFMKDNIIIYCTNQENSLQTAKRLDSLLRNFDGIDKTRFSITLYNNSNPIVKGVKKSLGELLSDYKRNVVVVCVFDESNTQMVIKQLAERKAPIVVYGMPTWLDSEILRLDYINKISARFTEQFVFDTTTDKALNFYNAFVEQYNTPPGKFAWLGYDVIKWLSKRLKGDNEFPFNIAGSFYTGAGYKFQFREVAVQAANEKPKTQYIENTFLHLLRMEDYVLKKEW